MSKKEVVPKKASSPRKAASQKPSSLVQKFCLLYENSLALPYFVWFLNAFNLGAIDRLASKHATDFTLKRFGLLLEELEKKIDRSVSEPCSDAFVAALKISLDALMETASTDKAQHLASVLAGTWNAQSSSWSEVSQTMKLIRELEDVHIMILREAYELNKKSQPNSVTTFTVGSQTYGSIYLDPYLPGVDPTLLTLCMSDLIAKGLVTDSFYESDEPKRRPGKYAVFPRYSISDLGCWFIEQLYDLDAPAPAEAVTP